MNKTALIAAVAENTGVSQKDAEKVISATFAAIAANLAKGEKIQISGFGTFETKHRQARVGRHPVTKEPMEIPATHTPTFKPSKTLKDSVGK